MTDLQSTIIILSHLKMYDNCVHHNTSKSTFDICVMYFVWNSAFSHRSFYQSALEQKQFGHRAPGLCDETLVCDWRAAEVKDRLHSFTFLHSYLPLWHLTHAARQQLLHILLRLRQHLQTDKSEVWEWTWNYLKSKWNNRLLLFTFLINILCMISAHYYV